MWPVVKRGKEDKGPSLEIMKALLSARHHASAVRSQELQDGWEETSRMKWLQGPNYVH